MEVQNHSKIPFIVSSSIIGVAALFLIIAGYLAFMPVNVIIPNVQPYKVASTSIKAGDNLVYIADVCKYREVLSIVSRNFVDENGAVYPLPEQKSSIAPGCKKTPVAVPTLLSYRTGKWYLTLDVQYQVNPLRKQIYHFRTETFTIQNTIIK